MNDDFLYRFHKAPRSEFAASLYERIAKPMKVTSRTQSFRATALAFSMVMLIGAALALSPATRALADSIIRQFGSLIFVQATPEPKPILDQTAGQQAVDSVEKKDPMQDQADSSKKQLADEGATSGYAQDVVHASQLTGFPVLAPSYLPEGYGIETSANTSGAWTVIHQNGGVRASITYQGQAEDSFLTIEEFKELTDQSKTVESPEIVDVTVRGLPGAWLPDARRKNILIWEENGLTYLVISNTLSLDEILKVAESLGK
jgi:hypothetical protein